MIEPFPIYTDNGALRDEGFRIDIIDDLENRIRLALLCQNKHHLYLLPCIKPGSVDYGHAPVQGIDLPADLFVFAGNDKELDGLAGAVDHLVNHISGNKQGHVTINHLLQIVQYKIAGCNNDHITEHNHTPQADIPVFVDNRCNNIRSSRTSVRSKGKTDTASTKDSTQDTSHKRLIMQQVKPGSQPLYHRKENRQDNDGIHRLHAELPA